MSQHSLQGRTEDEVRRAADELGEGKAIPLVANVADGDQVRRAVETLVDRWDRLDVVFANAGVNGVWAPIDELKPEEWEQTLRVNLTGTFIVGRAAAVAMADRGSGAIVNLTSINGVSPGPYAGAYGSTKAAIALFCSSGVWLIRIKSIPALKARTVARSTPKRTFIAFISIQSVIVSPSNSKSLRRISVRKARESVAGSSLI